VARDADAVRRRRRNARRCRCGQPAAVAAA
jgi:hypothetical protein